MAMAVSEGVGVGGVKVAVGDGVSPDEMVGAIAAGVMAGVASGDPNLTGQGKEAQVVYVYDSGGRGKVYCCW